MNKMKSYFLRNVINQIKSKKIETCIIFSISFMMSIFLSLIYFFGYNDSMESNIANQLDLSYEIKKSHIFTSENKYVFNNECENQFEYYQMFTDWIHEVGNNPRISTYEYDLVLDLNLDQMVYSVYGTDDIHYIKEKNMIMSSGRFFTEDELKNGSNYVVVSDQTYKDSSKTTYKIGDIIQLQSYNVSTNSYEIAFELEVIGIYQSIEQSTTFNINDDFINSKGIVVPNKMLDNYIVSKENEFDFSRLDINHIKFTVLDHKKFEKFKSDLKTSIKDLNTKLTNLNYPTSKLSIEESNESEIIHSTSRIKYVYQAIFILIFVIVAFVLVSSIHYFLKKKTREIAVYYSLGQSKYKIIMHYFVAYLLISIVATAVGLIIGYFISILLMHNMAQDSIDIQNEMLRFSMISILNNVGENAYMPMFGFTLISSVKIFIEITLIVGISSIFSVMTIIKDKIISRNGGWN